ncbi:TIGR03915 family putative DNA repair protein [Bergeyella sp. RCAD1439]|nr:TIGR03915 family putative DNA repair protein [Bergeyella sp. RCAD1439]
MNTLLYDGSFEGLLTAVFKTFEYRYQDVEILPEARHHQNRLFAETEPIQTEPALAERVINRVFQLAGKEGCSCLFYVYLSENPQAENLILHAIKTLIQHPKANALLNFADPLIAQTNQIVKSVQRETHRMKAFVRFEKLKDEMFFAKIDPDFNVLPLLTSHFQKRYADQKWMIFDTRRHYGLLYDLNQTDFFLPQSPLTNLHENLHEEEKAYQKLWQRYFIKQVSPPEKIRNSTFKTSPNATGNTSPKNTNPPSPKQSTPKAASPRKVPASAPRISPILPP